jgi:hypothetical protein
MWLLLYSSLFSLLCSCALQQALLIATASAIADASQQPGK